jgi:hypothetical protein
MKDSGLGLDGNLADWVASVAWANRADRITREARIEIISTRSDNRRRGDESLIKKKNQRLLTSSPTIIVPPEEVREKFKPVKPLMDIYVKQRGWTLDVLNIVQRVVEERRCPHPQHFRRLQQHGTVSISQDLPRAATGDCRAPSEFTNEDIYAHARELEQLHPDNRHIKDKIRQQLQVLRDAKLLIHVGSGVWRLP